MLLTGRGNRHGPARLSLSLVRILLFYKTTKLRASIQDYVQSIAIGLSSNQLNVNTTWSPDNKPGSAVQVTVAYTFVPLSYRAITRSLNLSSTAQVVINH